MELSNQVILIKGVGESLASDLDSVGIKTVADLLLYVPRRYDDYSKVVATNVAKPGPVTIKGQIEKVSQRYVRRGLHVTEAVIKDGTGRLKMVWFNQPYRAASLPRDTEVYVSGQLERISQGFAISHPGVEKVSSFTKNTARIVPVYPETRRIGSARIRQLIAVVLQSKISLPEILPKSLVNDFGLLPWREAIQTIHFPKTLEMAEQARWRLGFDELLSLMLAHALLKRQLGELKSPKIPFDEKLAKSFVASLPFKLTDAQRRAAWEILGDVQKVHPMNRLLEGDVGSGKTVVAAFVALMAQRASFQTAVMAPTEVLANQHYQTFKDLRKTLKVKIEILTGSTKTAERKKILDGVADGSVDMLIGTHALIQKGVDFKNLGLVVVDEQHRFGVRQRQALVGKSHLVPHVLSMTATPIPRSLMLTVYGELDVSILDELPPGRQAIDTKVISNRARDSIYAKIDQQIEDGRQVYVICPLVEDSDFLGVKSATSEFEKLQKTVFAHRKIGLLHGRLKADDKTKILDSFKKGQIELLVSTTVVEVGVDVPNATIMMVEGSERFGLAQLHQLRGRVGRGKHKSYCYLFTSADMKSRERLRYLERTSNGFELAEADLQLRGPGEIYGTVQHGELDLRIAKLTDMKLVSTTQKAVKEFIAEYDLKDYPELAGRVHMQQTVAHLL